MKTDERRIYLICNYIGSCVDGAASIYRYGNISRNVLSGAYEAYANYSSDETVICVVDTTVFGGGQRGMVFTNENMYYKGMFEGPMKWSYSNMLLQFSDELPNDTYFNRKNLKRLMAYLYDTVWSMAGIGLSDTGFSLIPRMKEILSDELEDMIKSGDIDLEALGVALWELVIDTFEFLLSPDNWLKELERVFEIRDSDEIKSMVISFDDFLEHIDFETWYLFFVSTDIMINMVILETEINRERASLADSFETLLSQMEDAVNNYYDGTSLIDIVCNLKEPIDTFAVEVGYDMETVQLLFED